MVRLRLPPRRSLAREIILVLAVKAVALATLYVLFFGPGQRPDLTPETVDRVILGAVPADAGPALAAIPRPAAARRNDPHA